MRKVHVLTFPGAALLDIATVLQVFRTTSLYIADLQESVCPYYELAVVAVSGGSMRTTVGVGVDTIPAQVESIDTFFVTGGSESGISEARSDTELMAFITRQSQAASRTAATSTGAFLLAAAGLVNGRRIATHWMDCEKLASEFPDLEVVADACVIDGPFWTSGGMLTGVDLALAMVEQDLGRHVANFTARVLISDARRGPGEPQLSTRVDAREAELGRIHRIMQWIVDNPGADLSTPTLARHACLSLRSLHRHFVEQTGFTPAKFVERTRGQAAQRLLAKTDDNLSKIAAACGFGSSAVMQRAFTRLLGVSPGQYRIRVRG